MGVYVEQEYRIKRAKGTGVGGQNSWELGGVEMEFLRII